MNAGWPSVRPAQQLADQTFGNWSSSVNGLLERVHKRVGVSKAAGYWRGCLQLRFAACVTVYAERPASTPRMYANDFVIPGILSLAFNSYSRLQ